MEDKIELTKSTLIVVYTIWNTNYLANPKAYAKIKNAEEAAKKQAEEFIRIFKTIES